MDLRIKIPVFWTSLQTRVRTLHGSICRPDANCLLSVADHCLRSEDYVNVIVADKASHLQYLSMDDAVLHCTRGIGIWKFASNDEGGEPDVVLACAGDIMTAEALGRRCYSA